MSAQDLLHERRVAPSVLNADYARLGEQVADVMDAGARVIHVDVMDGQFVPPISVGPPIVAALNEQVHDAGGILDVHLMIDRPQDHVTEFAEAGADVISIHYEATPHIHFAINAIHEAGARAGLAINPSTPVDAVSEVMHDIDLLLCMTVNPGWGGQKFIEASVEKVRRLRDLLPEGVPIEVDGGIKAENAGPCAEAGANLFVAGSSVMGSEDPPGSYREIAEAADAS